VLDANLPRLIENAKRNRVLQTIDSTRRSFKFEALMNTLSNGLTFFRVTQISCAISFGIYASFIGSIQEITPSFRLAFTVRSAVALVLGAIAGAMFWKMAWNARSGKANSKLKRQFIIWGIGFVVFTVASFAYGLRGHSQEKLWDYAVGTGTAVIFLTIVGSFLFFFARHFDREVPK